MSSYQIQEVQRVQGGLQMHNPELEEIQEGGTEPRMNWHRRFDRSIHDYFRRKIQPTRPSPSVPEGNRPKRRIGRTFSPGPTQKPTSRVIDTLSLQDPGPVCLSSCPLPQASPQEELTETQPMSDL